MVYRLILLIGTICLLRNALAQNISASSAVFRFQQTNEQDAVQRWQSIQRDIPQSLLDEWSRNNRNISAVHQTTLLETVFSSNTHQLQQIAQEQFQGMDVNQDGVVTFPELKAHYKEVYGGLRFAWMQLFSGLNKKMKAELEAIDQNGSGNMTMDEYQSFTVSSASSSTFFIPSALGELCAAVRSTLDGCASMFSQEQQTAAAMLLHQCQTATTWTTNKLKTETCVLQETPLQNNKTEFCSQYLPSCLAHVMPSDPQHVALNKRALDAAAVSALVARTGVGQLAGIASLSGFVTYAFVTLAVSALFVAFVMAPHISSDHQVRVHWTQQTEFAHWMVGKPKPICGTPILYWNDYCGALHSNRTRTCPSGVVYHPDTCNWWWAFGGRTCGAAGWGCRALCADIVTEHCPEGFTPKLTLSRNTLGFVTPIKKE